MICKFCEEEILGDCNFCENCGNCINPAVQPPFPEQKTVICGKRAITFGIIGIILSFIFSIVGCIVSDFGIHYGVKEYKYTQKMCGLVLSIIGMIFSVIATLIGFWLLNFILTSILSITTTVSIINESIFWMKEFLSSINGILTKISDFLS